MAAVRKVFLSSTGADLHAYREVAFVAIQKLDGWKCVRMEDFGARDWEVDTFCREQVRQCDLFVGIIGHRFGSGPNGSRQSYTQREYQAACEAGKPRLLYLAPDDFPIPANLLEPMPKIEAQAEFRSQLCGSGDRIVSRGFTSPDDLAKQIVIGIYNLDDEKRTTPDAAGYLNLLWEDTAYIDIRGLKVGNEAVHRFRIDELYTPLTTVLAPAKGQRKGHDETPLEQRTAPLQKALENRCVVLVGDPGAGKTTFLRRIAFAACETLLGKNPLAAAEMLPSKSCPFPLLVRAASLAAHIAKDRRNAGCPADADSPEWLIHYLESASRGKNHALDASFFREQLDHGVLLLLDGLDEVAGEAARNAIARLLELSARAYPDARIVATSRPPAYGGQAVIPGFATIQIGPLDDDAVAAFVGKWCGALYRAEEKASEHQQELLDEIRSRPDIEVMAVNPVMLTAIASLHWNRTRLPDQRAELYESVLVWLAQQREEKRKDLREPEAARMPAKQCLSHMEHLAYTMHSEPKGKLVEITRHAAARILAPRFRNVPEDERPAAAVEFLKEEETDSGILVSRGDKLRYWHLTFQEYLTARALVWREADRLRLLFEENKLYSPDWRETVLLLAGALCKQDPERVDDLLGEMLNRLGPNPGLAERARCVGLIGRILQDLRSWDYKVTDARYQENLDHLLPVFDARAAREIDFATRLEAADALGQAGDPRLGQDNWVRVEGGWFWMGAQDKDPQGKNYDKEASGAESPVHRVEVPPFLLGRYPVTVSEYERFVAAGGYRNEDLWTEGGYGQLKEPGHWRRQLRYSNRPVVEVSWNEAAAYCKWAKGRLPTEAEWECAARCGRGGVRYPWGDEKPDEHRANYLETGSRSTTPVGLYPEGATPNGIHDLAGNVWEWVQDWWGDYSGTQAVNPKGPDTGDGRVLRGGAWLSLAWYLRVSYRLRYQPGYRDGNLGFRCVREVTSL